MKKRLFPKKMKNHAQIDGMIDHVVDVGTMRDNTTEIQEDDGRNMDNGVKIDGMIEEGVNMEVLTTEIRIHILLRDKRNKRMNDLNMLLGLQIGIMWKVQHLIKNYKLKNGKKSKNCAKKNFNCNSNKKRNAKRKNKRDGKGNKAVRRRDEEA